MDIFGNGNDYDSHSTPDPRDEQIARLTTIVDESFGLQPVQSFDETLTTLERKLFEQRQELDRLIRDRDGWKRAAESQNRQWSAKCEQATELRADVESLTRERDAALARCRELDARLARVREAIRPVVWDGWGGSYPQHVALCGVNAALDGWEPVT